MKYALWACLFLVMTQPVGAVQVVTGVEEKIEEAKQNQALRQEQAAQKREEAMEKKQEMLDKRCQVLEERMGLRLKRYESNQVAAIRFGGNVEALVEKVISKAKEDGLETAAVERELEAFKALALEAGEAYEAHLDDLTGAYGLVCGETEAGFRAELEKSRKSLVQVREKVMEMRSFYQNNLKPSLQRLRTQAQVKGWIDESN